MVHHGAKRSEHFTLHHTLYDEATFSSEQVDAVPDPAPCVEPKTVAWLHLTGLHETERFAELGERFGISPLLLEDILNTTSRPKIEKRDDEIFVISRLVTVDPATREIDIQQFSLVLLPNNVLISFLEGPTAIFDPVLERVRTGGGGRIRRFGADYLAWALLDAVVDNYLDVIDRLDEAVLEMDERLQEDAASVGVTQLYGLKHDIGDLFRAIRPIREITSSLVRPTSRLIEKRTRPFFADLNDHALQVIESTEDLRERSSALRDFFHTAASLRMNEVMKVLTSFSTIFLPLTFIAGIYGMNFKHMPELDMPWAYPVVWGVFAVCAVGMIWIFRGRRWL
jgi:magnesium transporter